MKALRLYILIILSVLATTAQAQKTLLSRNPAIDSTDEKFGPNLKHFFCPVYGYGLFIGNQPATAKINPGSSYYLSAGARYKYKVSQHYALGVDLNAINNTYSIKQQVGKTLPDTTLHKKERLSWMFLALSVFNRFNFHKRGNVIGAYCDIGAQGGYGFSYTHFYYNKMDDGTAVRTRVRGLDYHNPFFFNAFIRFGFDRLSLDASYRFSELFKSKYNYPGLPRVCLSLNLSIY